MPRKKKSKLLGTVAFSVAKKLYKKANHTDRRRSNIIRVRHRQSSSLKRTRKRLSKKIPHNDPMRNLYTIRVTFHSMVSSVESVQILFLTRDTL